MLGLCVCAKAHAREKQVTLVPPTGAVVDTVGLAPRGLAKWSEYDWVWKVGLMSGGGNAGGEGVAGMEGEEDTAYMALLDPPRSSSAACAHLYLPLPS